MSTEKFTIDLNHLDSPEFARFVTQDRNGRVDFWQEKPNQSYLFTGWVPNRAFGGRKTVVAPEIALANPEWRQAIVELPVSMPEMYEDVSHTATDFLDKARSHMEDRAATYDSPSGERSMGLTVQAFNVITGHELTEEQGWLFMEVLKKVRSQQGDYREDNYEDSVAYASLRGETAAKERNR
ncbi:DUF6378 domain-containing protein [Kushneria phosphatilytica]|nr:DUF6378 domain-containing protein [Kushneria phosphatilytica]